MRAAQAASRRAYAPYSRFKVGAALVAGSGKIYTGCNVENASYGLTICAERSAVVQAVGSGEKKIQRIAIFSGEAKKTLTPCGACLQVLLEFGPEARVEMIGPRGQTLAKKITELLPYAFNIGTLLGLAFLCLAFAGSPLAAKARSAKDVMKDLKSEDLETQMSARRSLRNFRFSEIVGAMTKFARDPNPELRILMAQTLGELGGAEAADSLRSLYNREKEPNVRRALLVQLAGLFARRDEGFSFYRKAALNDQDDTNRYLALNQLSLFNQFSEYRRSLKKICRKVQTKDRYDQNQMLAALMLVEQGVSEPEGQEKLFLALQNPTVEIRRRAALHLGPLLARLKNGAREFAGLSISSRDPDPEVRSSFCVSLGKSRNPVGLPILKSLATDKEPDVRHSALEALASFEKSDASLDVFAQALNDPEKSIRSYAIEQLEKASSPKMVPFLEKVAQDDPNPDIRFLAKKAIAAIKLQQ